MEISIKKEDLQTKSLFVATPMYGGMNHGLYMKACLDLQGLCMQYGVAVKFSFLFNESLITRARNYLVDEFLHRSDCTHLLFLCMFFIVLMHSFGIMLPTFCNVIDISWQIIPDMR